MDHFQRNKPHPVFLDWGFPISIVGLNYYITFRIYRIPFSTLITEKMRTEQGRFQR